MITGFVVLTSTGQRITSESTHFHRITFFGYSGVLAGNPLNNSASVYVGINTGFLPIEVSAGSPAGLTLDLRNADDLSNYYVNGTKNDGLYYYGW